MSSPAPRHREKAQVLDETALDRALTRIAHEILERNGGAKDLAFVGLRTRGVSLAHRLAAKIAQIDGSGLERVTTSPEFDGFPMFSPDGRQLVFASNRNAAQPGETNIFLADWVE